MNIAYPAGKHMLGGAAPSHEPLPEITVGFFADASTMGRFAEERSLASKSMYLALAGLGLLEEGVGAGNWLSAEQDDSYSLALPITVLNKDRTSSVNGLRFSSHEGHISPIRMPLVRNPFDVNLFLTTRKIVLPGAQTNVDSYVSTLASSETTRISGVVDVYRSPNVPLAVARTVAKALGVKVGGSHASPSILQTEQCLLTDGEPDLVTPVVCGSCLPQIRQSVEQMHETSVATAAE